jgi:SAM-dependent methyltransferase
VPINDKTPSTNGLNGKRMSAMNHATGHSADRLNPAAPLRPAHGHVEFVDFDRSRLNGWIFLPDVSLDRAEILVDGKSAGVAELGHQAAVAAMFAAYEPFNRRTGYTMQLSGGQLRKARLHQIEVIGHSGERAVARMKSIVFAPELVPDIPNPPPRLIELTQGDHDVCAYRHLGFRYYQQCREIIGRHRDPATIRRLFDWGCGSGRVAAFFLAERDGPEVFGGDINHDAIAWCQEYLKTGQFRALDWMPPLPYADRMFDVIVSIGVTGGFGPADYAVWLPELQRMLTKDGLLVMTVQGKFAAEVLYPPDALAMLQRDGVFDGSAYDAVNTPDPRDTRYRGGMYLSKTHVARMWPPQFQLLEHLEGELNSDLDLLVVQRAD